MTAAMDRRYPITTTPASTTKVGRDPHSCLVCGRAFTTGAAVYSAMPL
jgi:hypothetical protein